MQLDGVDYAIKDAALTTEVASLANVARSGSYNDLTNKPTIPSGTITAVQANGTNVATSGTANIPAATTSKYGVTQLSSSTSSTSTSLAATPSAVKAAYDLANGKQDKLTSGTNIKTINGESILGSGNITIEGGGGSSGGGPNVVEVAGSTMNITAADNTVFLAGQDGVSTVNINLNRGYFPIGFTVKFKPDENCSLNFSGYVSERYLKWAFTPPTLPTFPIMYYGLYTEISVASAAGDSYGKDTYTIVVTRFLEVE